MPTEEIVQHFNELRQDIVLLYELKLALANCEYELQTLGHRCGIVSHDMVMHLISWNHWPSYCIFIAKQLAHTWPVISSIDGFRMTVWCQHFQTSLLLSVASLRLASNASLFRMSTYWHQQFLNRAIYATICILAFLYVRYDCFIVIWTYIYYEYWRSFISNFTIKCSVWTWSLMLISQACCRYII